MVTVWILLPAQAIGQAWDGTADSNWPGVSLNLDNENPENAEITTPEQLAQLAVLVNSGKTFKGKTITLEKDIDLNNQKWTPIGTGDRNPFNGVFDGKDQIISNLAIESDQKYLGLFGFLEAKATVKKLNIVISETGLTGNGMDAYIGAITGLSKGKIQECHISGGKISAKSSGFQSSHAGGIAGQNQGNSSEIESCAVVVDIHSEGIEPNAGGIVAVNDNSYIGDCQYEGKITTNTSNGSDDAGGIAGKNNNSEISYCHSAGSVEGTRNTGGITGQNSGSSSYIIACYSTATVTGSLNGNYNSSGGIVGDNTSGQILYCFATGNITGLYAGGITGYNSSGTISNCYATGEIGGHYTGGITGMHVGQSTNALIQNCYSSGKISGTSDYTGGIASLAYSKATIQNCIALNITCDKLGGRIANSGGCTFSNNYASILIPGDWESATADNGDGGDLTSQSFGDGTCSVLSAWSEDVWKNLDNEYLPTLDGLEVEQSPILRKPYLAFTIIYEEPEGGIITVKHADATDPEQTIESGKGVPGMSDLIITATPKRGYAFSTLTVNECDFVSGKNYCVTEDVKIEATFKRLPPPYIPTYYSVKLPKVKGVITKPIAGNYVVEEGYNFSFFLLLDKGYEDSKPIVKANEDIITPRASDGKYIIRNILKDMEITFEGINNSDPTSNELVEGIVKVQAVGSTLHIYLPKAETVYVYTLSGLLYNELELPAGNSQIPLTRGFYFVKIGNKTYKITI